jgi:hypothetical protein
MRRMNADLIRGIRGIREYPWFICPNLLWFDVESKQNLTKVTAKGLFAAIAFKSVVALRLLDLRESVEMMPEASAEESDLSN